LPGVRQFYNFEVGIVGRMAREVKKWKQWEIAKKQSIKFIESLLKMIVAVEMIW